MSDGPLRIEAGRSTLVSEELCSGRVWVDRLARGIPPSRTTLVKAMFEPGSRTAWHVHQYGEILHVLEGDGGVEEVGQPAQRIPAGAAIACTPGVAHWHGSGRDRALVVLGVVDVDDTGSEAQWGALVTDEECAAAVDG